LRSLHLDAAGTVRILQQKVAVIEAWLLMLTEEERFVVIKHLADQLSWPLILVEYQHRWGAEQARHERTLKRFQAQALEKVAAGIENWGLASEIHALFFR